MEQAGVLELDSHYKLFQHESHHVAGRRLWSRGLFRLSKGWGVGAQPSGDRPSGQGNDVIAILIIIIMWSSYDRIWFSGPDKQEILIFHQQRNRKIQQISFEHANCILGNINRTKGI
jgi:hypothetical protein